MACRFAQGGGDVPVVFSWFGGLAPGKGNDGCCQFIERGKGRAAGVGFLGDEREFRAGDQLHDRASYRYFWSLLERADALGQALPAEVRARYFG